MKYLSKEQILKINQATIQKHGGNFTPPANLLHEESLNYLIEIVKTKIFGEDLYPTIEDKAAVYCHHIICNHLFFDGNKRTGLAASLVFLNLNGFDLSTFITNDILTNFILNIASGKSDLTDCRQWFAHSVEKK